MVFLLSSWQNVEEIAKVNNFWEIISLETPVFMFSLLRIFGKKLTMHNWHGRKPLLYFQKHLDNSKYFQINWAVHRFRFRIVDQSRYSEILDLLYTNFHTDEPMSKAVGMIKDPRCEIFGLFLLLKYICFFDIIVNFIVQKLKSKHTFLKKYTN